MNFSLSEHQVLVFYGKISEFQVENCLPILSTAEIRRAEKYLLPLDRNSYIITKSILKRLISRFLELDEKEMEFKHNKNGKPYLVGNRGFQFNISHSEDGFAIGFVQGKEIGIDIESLQRIPNISKLENVLFTPTELEIFHEIHPDQKSEVFIRSWTKKEAMLKASGDGLTQAMNKLEVSFLKDKNFQLEMKSESLGNQTDWFLESCTLMDSYSVSIAVKGHVNCAQYVPVNESVLLFHKVS